MASKWECSKWNWIISAALFIYLFSHLFFLGVRGKKKKWMYEVPPPTSIILIFISTLPLLLITFIFYVHIIFFFSLPIFGDLLARCTASAIHYLITAKPYNIKNDMLHICRDLFLRSIWGLASRKWRGNLKGDWKKTLFVRFLHFPPFGASW